MAHGCVHERWQFRAGCQQFDLESELEEDPDSIGKNTADGSQSHGQEPRATRGVGESWSSAGHGSGKALAGLCRSRRIEGQQTSWRTERLPSWEAMTMEGRVDLGGSILVLVGQMAVLVESARCGMSKTTLVGRSWP